MSETGEQPLPADPAGEAAGDQEPRRRRKKSRWGAETEAGLQVLAASDGNHDSSHPAGEQDEPAPKKRRSRWSAPEEAKATALVPGMPAIVLPPSVAHLIDTNPEALELQRQLGTVSRAALSGG